MIPTVALQINHSTRTASLVGKGNTYASKDAYKAAGYAFDGSTWRFDAKTDADIARAIVTAADAGWTLLNASEQPMTAAMIAGARARA